MTACLLTSTLLVAGAQTPSMIPTQARIPTPAMIEFFDAGKVRQGLKLLDVPGETIVLGTDGWLHSLNPSDTKTQIRSLDSRYEPVSATRLRNQLRREYGRAFEVVATKNFLVVQPTGRGDPWSRLFEESHRAFSDYMTKRGVRVRQGRFPMVAVVMPDEQAMYREFQRLGIEARRVAGVYAGGCNRVITHDGGNRQFVRATVRHEAAHQSAFNGGVHSRLTDTPKWISEGIGQMFEPAGMTNHRAGARLTDRINPDSLKYCLRQYSNRTNEQFSADMMDLVQGDMMFEHPGRVENAYSLAWAMTFFLAEREPEKFAKLINLTANREPFTKYPRTKRVQDLEKILGYEVYELSKHVAWFLNDLR